MFAPAAPAPALTAIKTLTGLAPARSAPGAAMRLLSSLVARRGAFCLAALLCLWWPGPARAAQSSAEPRSCDAFVHADWTKIERWAWKELCAGNIADLNSTAAQGEAGDARSLRAVFLSHVVDDEGRSNRLGRHGIRLKNAVFTGPLDLSNARLKYILLFEDCTFEENVVLDWVTTDHDLWFIRTTFKKPISLRFLKSARSIYFGNIDVSNIRIPLPERDRYRLPNIDLSKSQIDGDITFGNVDIQGMVLGIYLRIGGSLTLSWCSAQELNFAQSVIKDQLNIVDCAIGFPPKPSRNRVANLYSVQIGQTLHLNRSKFGGQLYGENMDVRGSVNAQLARFSGFELAGASIGATIDLGATPGEDRRTWTRAIWDTPGLLSLRATKATSIVTARKESELPPELQLEGFTYSYIGQRPFQSTSSERLPAEWYIEFLGRDKKYSPQPYEKLAKVLRDSGSAAEANDVLYAGRKRQLQAAWEECRLFYAFWYFMFMVTIGFGYRLWLAPIWAICFILLGAWIFRRTPEAKEEGMPYGLAFSFDRLLPLVKLREKHYKIDLKGWQRYYFYFHQLMGYILGSFLIAGLSGLTK